MLRFNTAIFYDIENLTKGSSAKSILKGLSLTSIHARITSLDFVDRICLQRAYANWGDSRLSLLKDEINSLGIDPIQIFGFSRFQIKNAADIQLVVDAMEINFSRGLIDTYVIVSGDGGFASLAKKLHEYNRRVVVCAYANAANETLKAVSDYFIELAEPPEEVGINPPQNLPQGISHPLVLSMTQAIAPVMTNELSHELIHSTARKILNWFKQDTEAYKKLKKDGIHLSVIKEAFKYAIPDFKSEKVGFSKFVEFLQFLCHDSDICVGTAPPSNTLLFLREDIPPQAQPLPDFMPDQVHTSDRYQQLLSQGKVKITLTTRLEIEMLSGVLLNHPGQILPISEWLKFLEQELPELNPKNINNLFFTLIHTGILAGNPPHLLPSEQLFCLKSGINHYEEILDIITQAAKHKLHSILGRDFNLAIFEAALNL